MSTYRRLYYFIVFIWICLLSLIFYWNANGRIHFGLGLADLLYSLLILIILFVFIIIWIMEIRKGLNKPVSKKEKIMMFLAMTFLSFLLLKMTFLRGSESPWDGNVFF